MLDQIGQLLAALGELQAAADGYMEHTDAARNIAGACCRCQRRMTHAPSCAYKAAEQRLERATRAADAPQIQARQALTAAEPAVARAEYADGIRLSLYSSPTEQTQHTLIGILEASWMPTLIVSLRLKNTRDLATWLPAILRITGELEAEVARRRAVQETP